MNKKTKISNIVKKYLLFINFSFENDNIIIKLLIDKNNNLIKINNRKKLENQIKDYSFTSFKHHVMENENIYLNIIIIENENEISKFDLMDYSINNNVKWKVIYNFNNINKLNEYILCSSDNNKTNINLQQIISFLKEKKYF